MDNNTNNPTPETSQAQPTQPTPAQPTTPGQPEPKKSNVGLIIGIVVGVVVLFIGLLLFFFGMFLNGAIDLGMDAVDEIDRIIEETEKENQKDKKESANVVAATWNCISGTGGSEKTDDMTFNTTLELNEDMTFRYGPYGDLGNNHFSGKYTYTDERKKIASGDYSYYMVEFVTDEYKVDGEVQELNNLSDMEMGITQQTDGRGAITIFVSSNNMYYCYDY